MAPWLASPTNLVEERAGGGRSSEPAHMGNLTALHVHTSVSACSPTLRPILNVEVGKTQAETPPLCVAVLNAQSAHSNIASTLATPELLQSNSA